MSRPVEIPRTTGQVQIELDCEACGRAVPVIILIDRPLGSPLTWSGVMCRCGASQTIELMSEPEELNKIPPMVSSGSDERGEDEEPVVDGAVVIEKHRIDPQGGERARSIYACGPLRSTVEEARFDALLFSPAATDQELAVALKAAIVLAANTHTQAAPRQLTSLDSTAEAVTAALLQRFQIKPRGAKASRFDVDVAKLPEEDLHLLYAEVVGYLGAESGFVDIVEGDAPPRRVPVNEALRLANEAVRQRVQAYEERITALEEENRRLRGEASDAS